MLSRRQRVGIAVGVALATAAIALIQQRRNGTPVDFAMFAMGGRIVLDGGDPYRVIQPGGPYRFDSGYVYPLPGALAAIPFVWLPVPIGAVVFSALGMGLLAYLLLRDDANRWPMLLSAPALGAVVAGQWTPWLVAAALSPAMAWAGAVKPTIGLAAFLHRPSWRWLAVAAVLPLLGLLVMPDWPWRWLQNVANARRPDSYFPPLLAPGGFLLLAVALRWRRPDGRLLLAMVCVPQSVLLYDQFPLGLLARTRIEAYVFALWSYAAIVAGYLLAPKGLDSSQVMHYLAAVIAWGYYAPLVMLVLWRPDVTRASSSSAG